MTDNTFESKGRDQNVAQGERAIGKQENIGQEVRGDGNISSGTGNVTVHQGLRVKPRTVALGAGLGAVLLGAGMVGWYWLAPVSNNTISITGNNSGTAVIAPHGKITVNNPEVSPELLAKYSEELGETKQLINTFFGTLLEQKVPRDQWDAKLREIAAHYKELLQNWEAVQSSDPQIVKLKAEAKQALDAGDYDKAEGLLEDIAKHYSTAAAEANADNARLQRVRLRYEKAAEYWQKAAALLPEGEKKDKVTYLYSASFDLYRIGNSSEALPLLEQSLTISRETGDKKGEGDALNGISQIYHDWGEYDKALKYLEQSLAIRQEIGDRAGESTTLGNLGSLAYAQGDYESALRYYQQAIAICQEVGDRAGEGTTLNNISQIYDARGEYDKALKYLEQSLAIRQEIGDRAGEGTTLNNIGDIYRVQGDYDKALKYLEQSLAISQEVGDRAVEGTTLNNISQIYKARGEYDTALKYLEQSLDIFRETDSKSEEGTTLNNLATTAYAKGEHDKALKYLEQSLAIHREVGNRAMEAVTSWNIGHIYKAQGDLVKAEQHISRAVQLAEEIGHPSLEKYRKALEELRAEIKDM